MGAGESEPRSAGDGTRIPGVEDLAEGQSQKFVLCQGEREVECFVVRWRGEHYAYVNLCRHVAMSMDWVENQFLTEDAEFLLCPTHGALYSPDSGECVSGPPCGKSLYAVQLIVQNGAFYAFWPEDLP